MSEEEMNKYFNDKYGTSYKRLEELFDFEMDRQIKLLDKLEKLQQENSQLKERIEKAIEYINNNDEFYYGDELYDEYEKIINLLKGDKDDK